MKCDFKWINVLAILVASAAQAYSPPPVYILNRMLKERAQIKTMDLVGKVVDVQTHFSFDEMTHLDFVSGKFTASFTTNATDKRGEALGTHSGNMRSIPTLGLAWIELGLDPNPVRFKEALEELGVAPAEKTETGIDRIGSTAVWGWSVNENSGSRLQIEKDEFVFASYKNPSQLEIIVTDFTPGAGEFRIPKLIHIDQSGVERYRYELKSYKINAKNQNSGGAVVSAPEVREWVELVR